MRRSVWRPNLRGSESIAGGLPDPSQVVGGASRVFRSDPLRTITSVNHLPRLTNGLAVSLCLLAITMVGPWHLERPLRAAETIAHRPNFLVIVTDDQSPWDLRVYNPQSELDTRTWTNWRLAAWSWMALITWDRSSAPSVRRRGT